MNLKQYDLVKTNPMIFTYLNLIGSIYLGGNNNVVLLLSEFIENTGYHGFLSKISEFLKQWFLLKLQNKCTLKSIKTWYTSSSITT